MSWGYFAFVEVVRDLTADEESWIRDQCSGEFDTCKFIHEFAEEFDEFIDNFYWPKGVTWPYEDYAQTYREEGEIPFVDFQWEIVTWGQGAHLRLRDNEAVEPPLQAAELIRRFLHKWRPNDTFSMKYSIVSSDGEGSPGAFFITAKRVEWLSVSDWLFDREREWRCSSGELT